MVFANFLFFFYQPVSVAFIYFDLNLSSVLFVKCHEEVWGEPRCVEKTQIDPQWSSEEEHSHRSDTLPGRGQISG